MSDSYKKWLCDACGYIYDEEQGDPDSGLAPGTRYDDIPDDWACPLCGMMKSDLRLLPDKPAVTPNIQSKPKKTPGSSKGGDNYVVIIGAGIAGWSVAEAIRQRNPEQAIMLISADQGDYYSKPALSHALSKGRNARDLIEKDANTMADELGIELRINTRVLKVDSTRKRLTTVKGAVTYGKLIFALGAQQRSLPLEGDAVESVLKINDLKSYQQLQQQLNDSVKTITILGAGLIGCEFADDFTRAGYTVQVVDPNERALAALLPEPMSLQLQERLASSGVQWHFGTYVESMTQKEGSVQCLLSDGATIDTDIVISAAGLIANTQLAAKAGCDVDKGVQVNENMQTSIVDIYALGDCAEIEGRLFAYVEPIRRQAETIAASLNGESLPFEPRPPLIIVKTPTLPICLSVDNKTLSSALWKKISDDDTGAYYQLASGDDMTGFLLSDKKINQASSIYQNLQS